MSLQEDLLKLEIINRRATKALAEENVGDMIEAVKEYQKLKCISQGLPGQSAPLRM
jgi:hypothetical protein